MAPLPRVDLFGSHRTNRPRPGSHPYYIPTSDSFGAHRLPVAAPADPFASAERNFNAPSFSDHFNSNSNFGSFGDDHFDSHGFNSNFDSFDDSKFNSAGYGSGSPVPAVAAFPSSPIDGEVDAFAHVASQLDDDEPEAEQNPFHRIMGQFEGPARNGISSKGDISLDGGINPYRRVLTRPQPHYLNKRDLAEPEHKPRPATPLTLLTPVPSPTEEPAELAGGAIDKTSDFNMDNHPLYVVIYFLAGILVLQGLVWIMRCVVATARAAKAGRHGRRIARGGNMEGANLKNLGAGRGKKQKGPDVGEVE